MKCPICGSEMLHGYLNVGAAIWSERKHAVSLAPNESERYALHLSKPLVGPHHIESDCCPNCKHILIDIKDQENDFGNTH